MSWHKSEIKLQKFYLLINFIPQPDGHSLIKLPVIKKPPDSFCSFHKGMSNSNYLILGKEK